MRSNRRIRRARSRSNRTPASDVISPQTNSYRNFWEATKIRGVFPFRAVFRPAAGGFVGGNCKFPIYGNPKFRSFGLSMPAHQAAMLALPTERERCADVRMGDQDVVEALSGSGRFEDGAVEAVRGKPSDDPLLDQDRSIGPGSVGRCERVCAAPAGGAQAGPVQGDHRRASRGIPEALRRRSCAAGG